MIVSMNADELNAKLRTWREGHDTPAKVRKRIGKFYWTAWFSPWRLRASRSVWKVSRP